MDAGLLEVKSMDLEELVVGVRKPNLTELKELKVKVTVRLLVSLHYLKLTQARGISEIVNEALTEYFASVGKGRPRGSDGAPRSAPVEQESSPFSLSTLVAPS